MSQFVVSWRLCRGRFSDSVRDLNHAQLNWRSHPSSLTIGEMALHVAGVEASFATQLLHTDLDDFGARVKASATDGVVNEHPFPFKPEEITPEVVQQALALAQNFVEPILTNPSAELLAKEIKSALGPTITGEGALARLAFHPSYHHGQVYLLTTMPGFPA